MEKLSASRFPHTLEVSKMWRCRDLTRNGSPFQSRIRYLDVLLAPATPPASYQCRPLEAAMIASVTGSLASLWENMAAFPASA